jgi:hypothetical protein
MRHSGPAVILKTAMDWQYDESLNFQPWFVERSSHADLRVTGNNGLIGAVVIRQPVGGGRSAVRLLRPTGPVSIAAPGARRVMP